MPKNKKQINEFALTTILGSILLFGWITGFFSNLADKIDAYSNNRSVEINNALKKIFKKLGSNKSFINKIDNYVKKSGVGPGMITMLMNTSEAKNALKEYENDDKINMEELKTELSKVLTKAMYDEAKDRGMIDKIEKKVKNTNWA